MKKIVTLILALTMLFGAALCFSSCGNPKTVFKPEGESKGTLKLGFDAEYPPYGYLDSETNEYAGFDIEFAKAVCADIGYTLQLVPVDWDSKDAMLDSGAIDCIWSGFTIQGREDQYQWTVPYSSSAIVVLTTADSGISSIAGLAGKTVTVQLDSSGETALQKDTQLVASLKNGEYKTCPDYNTGFSQLQTGAVDAVVIDIGVAQDLIKNKTGFVILDEVFAYEQYGVGFKLGNTELCKLVNDSMCKLSAKADEIAAKYELGDSIKVGNTED